MVLVAGLGNPGPRYAATRHNAGFMLADRLAAAADRQFLDGPGQWQEARIEIENTQVLLMKPMAYMNRSGPPIAQALSLNGLSDADLLVMYDDFAIPLGSVRARPSGSSGGHNGIQSVMDALQTTSISRLRLGIGLETAVEDQVDFVLAPFTREEASLLADTLDTAMDAVHTWVRDGIRATMNRFNRSSGQ